VVLSCFLKTDRRFGSSHLSHAFVLNLAGEDDDVGLIFYNLLYIGFCEPSSQRRNGVCVLPWQDCNSRIHVGYGVIVDRRNGLDGKAGPFNQVSSGCHAVVLERQGNVWIKPDCKVFQFKLANAQIGAKMSVGGFRLEPHRLSRPAQSKIAERQADTQTNRAKSCDPNLGPRWLQEALGRVGHRLLGEEILYFALTRVGPFSFFSQSDAEGDRVNDGAFRLVSARGDGAAQNAQKQADECDFKATVIHAAALAQISRFVQ